MSARYPWSVLGLDGPTDSKGIRRAYATRLREIDRNDAAVFQNLVAARDHALRQAKSKTARPSLQQIAESGASAPRIHFETVETPSPKEETRKPIVNNDSTTNPGFSAVKEPVELQFWATPQKTLVEEFKEQIDHKNWQTIAEKFRDESLSMTGEDRIEIERYLYNHLIKFNEISIAVQASTSKLDNRQAALFKICEDELEWLSDALTASKRLGIRVFDAGLLAELRDLRLRRSGRFVETTNAKSGSGFNWWYLLIGYFVIRLLAKIAENL